jgi:hypothetical protein
VDATVSAAPESTSTLKAAVKFGGCPPILPYNRYYTSSGTVTLPVSGT